MFIDYLIQNSVSSVVIIFFFCVLYCSPAYLYPAVIASYTKNSTNESHNLIFYVVESQLNKKTNNLIFMAMFYGQALFARILPIILVVTFISLLIHSLIIVNKNKKNLIAKRRVRNYFSISFDSIFFIH
jgi:hypothetical protein